MKINFQATRYFFRIKRAWIDGGGVEFESNNGDFEWFCGLI